MERDNEQRADMGGKRSWQTEKEGHTDMQLDEYKDPVSALYGCVRESVHNIIRVYSETQEQQFGDRER